MDKLSTRLEKLAHWRGVIGEWRASGSSQAAFCRDRGLPAWKFAYWLKRVSEEETPAEGPAFATVFPAGSGLRLVLPGAASPRRTPAPPPATHRPEAQG
jgi:hypothetical protein